MRKFVNNIIEDLNELVDNGFIHTNHLTNANICIFGDSLKEALLCMPFLDALKKQENIIIFCEGNLDVFKYFLPEVHALHIQAKNFNLEPIYRYNILKKAFLRISGCKKTVNLALTHSLSCHNTACRIKSNEKFTYKNLCQFSRKNYTSFDFKEIQRFINSAFHRKLNMNKSDFYEFYMKFTEEFGNNFHANTENIRYTPANKNVRACLLTDPQKVADIINDPDLLI